MAVNSRPRACAIKDMPDGESEDATSRRQARPPQSSAANRRRPRWLGPRRPLSDTVRKAASTVMESRGPNAVLDKEKAMRKLMSFALVAAIPVGLAVLARSVAPGHGSHAKRRRKYQRLRRRLGRQSDALGEAIRESMPDLPVLGHKS